jgi:LCP family protein required for cell wall assembly
MVRPRRRFVISLLLIVGVVVSVAALRLAWEWKQALDNVDAMIVEPVSLPSATPEQRVFNQLPNVPEPTPEPTAIPEPDDPVNILLLGTDARVGEDISRTDAIILVRLDPRHDRVSMLSFPRDLWVQIPRYGKARINAAYPIGERKLGPGYGAALAKETVSRLVGLPVHHFVLINFEGFKAVIDKLDGIYIDVPKPIDDPAYPTDAYEGDTRTIKIHFDAGRQRMGGERALIYARTRHADSDFGRNQRQQQVLMAIFDRVREQDLLAQLTSLDDYTGALRDYIRTDISSSEMLSLASLGAQLHPQNVQRYAIEPTMLINLKKPATFAADPKAIKRLVNQMINGSAPTAGGEEPSG